MTFDHAAYLEAEKRLHETGGPVTTMGVGGSVSAANASGPDTAHDSASEALARSQRRLQARAANAPIRRASTAARKATIAARTGPTGFRVGWWVRTNTPRSRRFHNRSGVVVTNNLGEVGVSFGTDWSIRLPDVDAWFLPSELEHIR